MDVEAESPIQAPSEFATESTVNDSVEHYFQKFDLNFYESQVIVAENSKKGELLIDDDTVAVHCGMSIPFFNNLYIKNKAVLSEKPWLQCADFFRGGELDYQLVIPEFQATEVEPQIFEDGFVADEDLPVMVFDAEKTKLTEPEIYSQLTIQTVETEQQFEDFRKVAGPSFGMPDFVAERVCTPGFGFSEKHELYIGYLNGVPVSTSLLYRSHGIAGIYWVATAEGHRGNGYGEALTYHATKMGLQQGSRFASLQASKMGEPVYKRIGYETLYYYKKYLRNKASD